VAGAPFFFGEGDTEGAGLGVSLALGVEEGDGDSVGDGVGETAGLRFFFFGEELGDDSGVGVGEDFFFFGEEEALGVAVSAGVGLAAFFLGDGAFSGDAVGLGEGDFSAVVFFLVCLRGVGVGVGAKIFLSLVPNDSSADARTAKFVTIARLARAANPMANARRLAVIPSAVEEPRGASSDVLRGPSTSLRFARDDT
jgi:hypothetical protein